MKGSPLLTFETADVLLARPLNPVARNDEVHVWPLLLEGSAVARAHCESLLAADEKERARRFYHEHRRLQFIFAHGLVRHILGAYLERDPAVLEFAQGEFGKPRLDGPVAFNLSHSHERALLAVSSRREIGVDIEAEDSRTDVLGIASSYFSGPEFEAIQAAPEERRREVFFRHWAAKEAVLKAEGGGLSIPLKAFHVRFDAGPTRARVESLDESVVRQGWVIRALACGAGWHGAVAALSDAWFVRVMNEP